LKVRFTPSYEPYKNMFRWYRYNILTPPHKVGFFIFHDIYYYENNKINWIWFDCLG
jgi:hypothetical protein